MVARGRLFVCCSVVAVGLAGAEEGYTNIKMKCIVGCEGGRETKKRGTGVMWRRGSGRWVKRGESVGGGCRGSGQSP